MGQPLHFFVCLAKGIHFGEKGEVPFLFEGGIDDGGVRLVSSKCVVLFFRQHGSGVGVFSCEESLGVSVASPTVGALDDVSLQTWNDLDELCPGPGAVEV